MSLLASLFLWLPAFADTTTDGSALAWLQQAVEQYTRPLDDDWSADAMRVAWADLDGDGLADGLVYLDGLAWCGSGGCTLLVFAAVDSVDVEELGRFTPVAEISLVQGPVVIATDRTDGWCDLVVRDEDGTQRRLSFDGETYPHSPADGAAEDAGTVDGTIVFADA